MLSEKEMTLLYETIMSAPGMSETVKADLKMPRKNVLLLAKVIEKGLQAKAADVDGLWQSCGRWKFRGLAAGRHGTVEQSGFIGYARQANFIEPEITVASRP